MVGNSDKPFQRKGAISNAHVGRAFEERVRAYFNGVGLTFEYGVSVEVGVNGKRQHRFDLGSIERKVLVECKAHTWTESNKVPSAKMRTWNEAMYLFHAAPKEYRKLFVALRNLNGRTGEALADYYVRTFPHLIPGDVEIWEYEESQDSARRIK